MYLTKLFLPLLLLACIEWCYAFMIQGGGEGCRGFGFGVKTGECKRRLKFLEKKPKLGCYGLVPLSKLYVGDKFLREKNYNDELVEDSTDWQSVRREFPFFKFNPNVIYFDNAATSHKPKQVIQEERDVYERFNSNVHRSSHKFGSELTDKVEAVREKIANFLNASQPYEIIFTSGATESLNLIANSYARDVLGESDEILVTCAEHHSNLLPWQSVASEKKAKLKILPLDPETNTLDIKRSLNLITPKSKILSFCHSSNVLGRYIKNIGQFTRAVKNIKKDIKIVLDATQAPLHAPLDVIELDIDFLALSSHKMIGPFGLGILYGKKNLLEQMKPWKLGGEMVERATFYQSEFADIPSKFEGGTPPIAQICGFGKAIDFLNELGYENIARRNRVLSDSLRSAIESLPRVRRISGTIPQSSISSFDYKMPLECFVIDGISCYDLAATADTFSHICLRSGHHCAQPLHEDIFNLSTGSLRASLAFYNTEDEIHKFKENIIKNIHILDGFISKEDTA